MSTVEPGQRYQYIGNNPLSPRELQGTKGVVTQVNPKQGVAHYRPDGWDYQVAVLVSNLVKDI